MLDPTLLKISLLAGLLGLDSAAAFQLMVSRPFVSGWLVGWLAGDAMTGLTLGCLLELLWVNSLPVGAFVPPDLTFASIFTVGGALLLKRHPAAGWPVSAEAGTVFLILVSIPLALFGGVLEIKLRRFNVRLCHWIEDRLKPGSSSALSWGLAASLALLFAKNCLLTALCLSVLVPFCGLVLANLPLPILHGLSWMYWLVLMLGLTLFLDLFWSRRFAPYLVFSFAVSWLLIHGLQMPLLWMFPLILVLGLVSALVARRRMERGY